MSRPFNFRDTAKNETYFRQFGKCAYCAEMLYNDKRAHHVIPNQTGRISDPKDVFLKSVDNCVYLCTDCHNDIGHEYGRYKTGAVAIPEDFVYSHGTRNSANHREWVRLVNSHWERIRKRNKR